MNLIETLDVISCIVLTPGLTFLGVAVWNAAIMPQQLRRPIALLMWMQAATCAAFLVGMILLVVELESIAHWLRAVLVGAQAITVTLVIVRTLRLHRVLTAVLIVTLTLALGGI